MPASPLSTRVELGPHQLPNRIVHPPLTRNRATAQHVPTPSMAMYYAQRTGAGLLIAEGTAVSEQAVAYPRVPGIWREDQVGAWMRVTDMVHAAGGIIYLQLWHAGRVSHSANQPGEGTPVAPSAIPIAGSIYVKGGPTPFETPRALAAKEVRHAVSTFGWAALAAKDAGFDGVELHAANGYLIDQFLNSGSNKRTDRYGGSLDARCRLLDEVFDAVADVWGADRVGVRLSPSSTWMDCWDEDPRRLYTHVVDRLAASGVGYLHLIEPTVAGSESVEAAAEAIPTLDLARRFGGTVIVTGGHTIDSAEAALRGGAELVGFGRPFIANPDLPHRIAAGIEWAAPDPATFYSGGDRGYIDYPMSEMPAQGPCRRCGAGTA